MIAAVIEETLRRHRPRLMASLYRAARDLDLANDALQEASVRAMETWPVTGLPDNPAAWLFTVARRCLVDLWRAQGRGRTQPLDAGQEAVSHAWEAAEEQEPQEDDRLRLLVACCSSALSERERVALALRSFLGLSTREIARAFLEPEATTAQRLVRAKRKLAQRVGTQQDAASPPAPDTMVAVTTTLYLVFNEGHLATEGDALVRHHLVEDAISLARMVVELVPHDAEALGLLSLMLLHASRRAARQDAQGDLLTMEEQDRTLWDRDLIAQGQEALARVMELHAKGQARLGPYQLQAAIASLHCQAQHADHTDWVQIAALYQKLLAVTPTAVVEMNAAIAVAMAGDIKAGLAWLAALEAREELKDHHLLAAARAGLFFKAGHLKQADRFFRRARKLARNEQERRYLTRRLEDVARALGHGGA